MYYAILSSWLVETYSFINDFVKGQKSGINIIIFEEKKNKCWQHWIKIPTDANDKFVLLITEVRWRTRILSSSTFFWELNLSFSQLDFKYGTMHKIVPNIESAPEVLLSRTSRTTPRLGEVLNLSLTYLPICSNFQV